MKTTNRSASTRETGEEPRVGAEQSGRGLRVKASNTQVQLCYLLESTDTPGVKNYSDTSSKERRNSFTFSCNYECF